MDGLSSICAGIGSLDEDDNGNPIGYEKGEYCLDNLKDLLRFLRRDDPEKRDVFKQVCSWNIVGKDLIPIIEYYQEDRNLLLTAVKILVFLTMPVEPSSMDISQQIEYLWNLKSAITLSDIVPVIVSLLENPLENLENESFTEDDWKLTQLVLTLFRNILAIQDLSTQQKAGRSASQFLSLRDKFLELLFQENVMDLIIVFSQHIGGPHAYLRQDNLLLLEIFYHIFKGQNPEIIAQSNLKFSKVEDETENSMSSLQSIMKEEHEKRKLAKLRNLSCYSQFTGTYTRITLDGSKALFKGNPCSIPGDVLRQAHKKYRGPSKRTIWDNGELPSTKNRILEYLFEFINQFLVGGYNVLMRSVREDIDKEYQEIQSSDTVAFFHVAQFVTSFQYQKCLNLKQLSDDAEKKASVTSDFEDTIFKGCVCGPVSETLNESMFLTVISQWRYAFDSLKLTNNYNLLSAAGSLMKSLMQMLYLVLKESPEDSDEPRTALILLYKLFYDQTEEGMTHFFLNMIKSFDTHKQSKSYLSNLVETMHLVLRLMEHLQSRGSIRVSKKARKKTTKKAEKGTVSKSVGDNVTTQDEAGSFTCEQSENASILEKEKANEESVREAESVGDLVQIDEPVGMPVKQDCTELDPVLKDMDANNDVYPGTGDSSGDEQPILTNEVDFNASTLVSALANNTIVCNLCWLLKFYRSNPIRTNHYILSILQRICDDLELSPMLYQLSLLTIFYEILEEQKLRPCKEYENIVKFLSTLVRRMLRRMKNYPLLAVEVLFWKTRKECHYISCGSMVNEINNMRNKNIEGISGSYDNSNPYLDPAKCVRRSLADALGDDDYEETHWESQGNTNLPKVSMERELNMFNNSSPLRKHGLPRKRVQAIGVDLEQKLMELFAQFKNQKRRNYMIANALDDTGEITAAQVSCKLKQLGLVPQKKRSNAKFHLKDEGFSDVSLEDAVESDDETLSSLRNRQKGSDDKTRQKRIAQKLHEETSDDELLTSIQAKKKKTSAESDKGLCLPDLTEKDVVRYSLAPLREELNDRKIDSESINSSSDSEPETIGEDNPVTSDLKSFANVDESLNLQLDDLEDFTEETDNISTHDDLVDFTEETDTMSTQKTRVLRRQLRMVIDSEDEE